MMVTGHSVTIWVILRQNLPSLRLAKAAFSKSERIERAFETQQANKMKKLIFALMMAGMSVLSAVQPKVGTHIVPPSRRGYNIQAIRESGERGGLLLTVGT